jgi:hypothetical protein
MQGSAHAREKDKHIGEMNARAFLEENTTKSRQCDVKTQNMPLTDFANEDQAWW